MWSLGLVELPSTILLEKRSLKLENPSWEETWSRCLWQAESWSPKEVHVQSLDPMNMSPNVVKGTLLTILR